MIAKKNPILLLVFIILFLFQLNVHAEDRLALIIGNSDYEIGKLKNAVNDARLMKSTLTSLGFKIIYVENTKKRKMKEKVQEFADRLKSTGSVGLFFYAGHGVQIGGKNYLVPLGVDIENESDVEFECFPADRILASMEWAKNRLNIVILDACRNNPFERSFSRSFNRGLAQMHGGSGMIIAYATAPGSTASDGPGANNGIYTASLVKVLKTPNLSIEKVFSKTREHVYKNSREKQLPWTASSIIGDFIFKTEIAKPQKQPQPQLYTTNKQTPGKEKIEPLNPNLKARDIPVGKSLEWYLARGERAEQAYMYSLAIKYYNKILKTYPSDLIAKQRLNSCQKKLSLIPTGNVIELYKKAENSRKKGNLSEALNYYRGVVQIDSKHQKARSEANKLEALLDYQNMKELNISSYRTFKKAHPDSDLAPRLKKALEESNLGLPNEKHWEKITRNSKGFYERTFFNDHLMVWIPELKLWADKYEVSQKQYAKYKKDTRFQANPDHPAHHCTVKNAQNYCRNFGFRLPTEKEWEMIAGSNIYPWGDEAPGEDNIYRANYEVVEDGYDEFAPVTSFTEYSSPYGILNLAGNVWEWISEGRVKGGSYFSFENALKIKHSDTLSNLKMVGFRCVMEDK